VKANLLFFLLSISLIFLESHASNVDTSEPKSLFNSRWNSRFESKERVLVEDTQSQSKIEIRFNDSSYEFEKERDDFANKDIKLFEIATNSYGTKIRQGLVFLHAIITNYGSSTKISFGKIWPTMLYQEQDVELLARGEWEREGTILKPVYKTLEKKKTESIPYEEIRVKQLSSDFIVSIKAFEFEDFVSKITIGKELPIEDGCIVLPERASILVKWILSYKAKPSNFLDFLPAGQLPKHSQEPESIESFDWQGNNILADASLLDTYHIKEKEITEYSEPTKETYKFLNEFKFNFCVPACCYKEYSIKYPPDGSEAQKDFCKMTLCFVEAAKKVYNSRSIPAHEHFRLEEYFPITERGPKLQKLFLGEMNFYLNRHFLIVGVADEIHFRKASSLRLILEDRVAINFLDLDKTVLVDLVGFKARFKR
jgi:hypothetical protein